MLFQILFIWLIARKRKNWARWVWIVVMIGGTAIAIIVQVAHPQPQNGLVGSAAFFLVYLVSLASGVYLLMADSRAWFRKIDSPPADLRAPQP